MPPRRSLAAGIVAACLAAAFLSNPTTSFAEGNSTPPPPLASVEDRMGGLSHTTDTIIVTFDSNQRDPAAAAEKVVEQAVGDPGAVTEVVPITKDTVAVTIDETMTPTESVKLGQQVEKVAGVDTAEPASIFTPESTNDTYYSFLWNVNNSGRSAYGTDAENAWPASTGTGAVIGVLDTGITSHTDLNANIVGGYDFITNPTSAGDGTGRDPDPTDAGDFVTGESASSWHGTHVTGIAVALRNNSAGVVGVAPGAKVQPLRALGKGGGTEADIISALRWGAGLPIVGVPANQTPVDVINMSIGGPAPCSSAMQAAIDAAVAKGVPVVVAAGNSTVPVATFSPGGCKNIIRVAATGFEGTLAGYSNYGTATSPMTISAPGGTGNPENSMDSWIVSTWNTGSSTAVAQSYIGMDGTSMAAPHVAAVAALLKSLDKSLTPAEIASIMTSTATHLAAPCDTTRCGAGAVNAAAAVRYQATQMLSVVGKPTVTGGTVKGSTLTVSLHGVPSVATVAYQWLRAGAAITGATSPTYVLTTADAGKAISVRVTPSIGATGVAKVSNAVTASATPAPALGTFKSTKSPSTSGTFKVGQTLKVSHGTQSPAPSTVSYRWLRNGASISSATHTSYKLTSSDKGKQVSVRITVSHSGYTTASYLTSSHIVSTFVSTKAPTASGTFQAGHTVKASHGTQSPTPSKVTYRWLRDGASISSATHTSYKLTKYDKGHKISVRATVSRSGYTTASFTSVQYKVGA
jgi:serine protease